MFESDNEILILALGNGSLIRIGAYGLGLKEIFSSFVELYY